jgi:hypothetical protein
MKSRRNVSALKTVRSTTQNEKLDPPQGRTELKRRNRLSYRKMALMKPLRPSENRLAWLWPETAGSAPDP